MDHTIHFHVNALDSVPRFALVGRRQLGLFCGVSPLALAHVSSGHRAPPTLHRWEGWEGKTGSMKEILQNGIGCER